MALNRRPSFSARGLFGPLEHFLGVEAASGVVLLVVTAVALAWANSQWAGAYESLWHTTMRIGAGPLARTESLHFWINDGLMTIFFLVVGLEIRRELHEGTLSRARQAALPLVAAAGGVLLPAVIYALFNPEPALLRGWAVPTATDIAFAVGVLAVLGKRVPTALRVLLLALAIIDDIAAIVIIALFYSGGVQVSGLALAAAGIALTWLLQRVRVRNALVYVLPGAIIWIGLLRAGVHPALTGVVLGMMTPVRAAPGEGVAPVTRLEAALHPWVAFGIMPLFALANAGVNFSGVSLDVPANATVAAGIFFGLVLGKPIGIVLVSFAAWRLGLCELPPGVDMRGLLVMGLLGGIGFTMSIFIAYLAFPDPQVLAAAKFAVLAASCTAGALGLFAGWRFLRPVA
jgi:NhaA family Na+:H+ antiporter